MIGVAANSVDLETAREFFELFKTPWEPVVPGRKYGVVLSTQPSIESFNADLIVSYGSGPVGADRESGRAVEAISGPLEVVWQDLAFPVYGGLAAFDDPLSTGVLRAGGRSFDYRFQCGPRRCWRVGYDLFQEVGHLLSKGQPPSQASTPTLEIHIALLRHLLLASGIAFVEVPPRPYGYDFVCCLTHDVDFFGIRRHKFDRTLIGFVVRASVGTFVDFARGRRPLADVARNWAALALLPFVFLGLMADFWNPFDDYARIEGSRRSTFFLIPFKNRPGVAFEGHINKNRAVRYQASEIGEEARKTMAIGNELAVHGIDAWRDTEAGRSEKRELISLTQQESIGVRMHWLYFAGDSAQQLAAAGFRYDSTWGYNDAVGYRAGTSQVFQLPRTQELMELPLSVMDSALFYRQRMGLGEEEAWRRCQWILENAKQYGGTLVVNWHDRSLAPERLWGRFYKRLIAEIEGNRVWFALAGEAVDWFRWRRSIRLNEDVPGTVSISASAPPAGLPASRIAVHRPDGIDPAVEERRFGGEEVLRLCV